MPSINGAPFDTTETSWGVSGGWQVRSWLAVEIGYEDLGQSGLMSAAANAVAFTFTPIGTPGVITGPNLTPGTFPPVDGFVSPVFTSALTRTAAINVEQWQVGAKLRKTLTDQFDAHWYLGIARSSFDVEGSVPVFVPTDMGFPAPLTIVRVPNARPDAEVGINWGIGFDWHALPRLDAGLQWRRHHTGVIDVDSYRASVSWRL
jgi:hypothetical protein